MSELDKKLRLSTGEVVKIYSTTDDLQPNQKYLSVMVDGIKGYIPLAEIGTAGGTRCKVYINSEDKSYQVQESSGNNEALDTDWTDYMSINYPDTYQTMTTLPEEMLAKNTSQVVSMCRAFAGCANLLTIPLYDTSNVIDMSEMFLDCESLVSIPLMNTSKVTNIENMFNWCKSLKNIPLLDTSNVENMYNAFNSCDELITIPELDFSNVNDMRYMFYFCGNLTSIPRINAPNVTGARNMFSNCSSLYLLSTINMPKLSDASAMFDNCSKLTAVNFENYFSPTVAIEMFNECSLLETINCIDVSNIDATYDGMPGEYDMFARCDSLRNIIFTGTVNERFANYDLSRSANLTKDSILSFLKLNIREDIEWITLSLHSNTSKVISIDEINGVKNPKIEVNR